MKVILQPCASKSAKEHLEHTVYNADLTLLQLKPFLKNVDYDNLIEMYGKNQIRVWGVTASSKSKWDKMQMGDIAFLSGDGRIFSTATITYKIQNDKLAEFLWDKDANGNVWEYIYFLDELNDVNITYLQFNKIVGYKENFIIQGFTVLSEDKSECLIDLFYLESHRYIDNTLDEEEYKKATIAQQGPQFNQGVNIPQKTYRRAEQAFLRKRLFGNKYNAKCSICGRELPIEFLWCAHIKKRSQCSIEELMDFDNIVTPMCKLGCDDLFEKGYIGVVDGLVSILNYTNNKALDSYMDNLNDKKCEVYNENNKKYFEWQSKHIFK